RLQGVESAARDFTAVPHQSGLAEFGSFLVDFAHNLLQGLLQMLLVVYLKDHFPRRRREDWSIDGKSKLTTEGRSDVLANIESSLSLLFVQSLAQVGRYGLNYAK